MDINQGNETLIAKKSKDSEQLQAEKRRRLKAATKQLGKTLKPKLKAQQAAKPKKQVKKRGGPRNIDWYSARSDYLQDSSLTYTDIAKKYGCSKKAVQDAANKDSWPQLRQDLSEKAFEEFKLNLLDQKSKAQSDHLISYQNMRALANRAIVEMSNQNFARDRHGNLVTYTGKDGTTKPILAPLNAFELEKLAKALHQAIVGERIVLGMPSSVSGITDNEGGDLFKGLSDLFAKASEPKNESNAPPAS